MAIQSIRTAVQVRDVAGDHFFVTPRKMALGEMHGIAELNHLAQKVGPCPEAFDDARNQLSAGTGAPKLIGRGRFAGGFGVFDNSDLRRRLR